MSYFGNNVTPVLQMANSLWSEENSPKLYLFFCALVTVEFYCETCYIDSMVKNNRQKIVVLWNVAFSTNVGELAFWDLW